MDSNVLFSITTQPELEGRELRSMKPDKNGVFRGVPLNVLGITSRNNISYDQESVIRCITNVSGRFRNGVAEGNMEGEWGHPLITKKEDIARLLYIDRTRISHYICGIYGKKSASGDFIIIYGDVVPFGPYGKYLEEGFEDPKRDVSFSIRSAARVTGTDGPITYKSMLAVVTFDAEGTPGYRETNARYADPSVSAATESMSISVDEADVRSAFEHMASVGMESVVRDQQILDIFQANSVKIRETINGVYDPKTKALITPQGPVSVFASCFGNK